MVRAYYDPMTTTMTPNATYTSPVTRHQFPCVLVERRTTTRGRAVASIVIPAEHSGLGMDVDLVVADRSVEGPTP